MSKRKAHKRKRNMQSKVFGTSKDIQGMFGMVATGVVAVAGIQAMTGALKK